MRLRLLADDLTGALDSAACFVPIAGPVMTTWTPSGVAGSLAIDAGTRETDAAAAQVAITHLAPLLAGGDPAFKKIDSLLRGHVAGELAACLHHFDHCVLAPAFPFQGRITRGGRQSSRGIEIGVDLVAELRAHGIDVTLRAAGDAAPGGVSLWDATTDADLDAIVAAGRALPGHVLWCGTGGLAAALAGHCPVPAPRLQQPVLALIGSDHATSRAQLTACGNLAHRIGDGDAARVSAALAGRGAVAVSLELPAGLPRAAAAQRIADGFDRLLHQLTPPGTLVVAGGATLRDLCQAVDASGLEVDGQIEPGVPCSRLRGGRLDGQRIVSKSGAFGEPDFLVRLFANF